jgi:hypothetical protein
MGALYPDGRGGMLTPAEWFALPQKERDRIQTLVDKQIEAVVKRGIHD